MSWKYNGHACDVGVVCGAGTLLDLRLQTSGVGSVSRSWLVLAHFPIDAGLPGPGSKVPRAISQARDGILGPLDGCVLIPRSGVSQGTPCAAWNGGQRRRLGLECGHRPRTPGLPSTSPGWSGPNPGHGFREWSRLWVQSLMVTGGKGQKLG